MSFCYLCNTTLIAITSNDHPNNIVSDILYFLVKLKNRPLTDRALPVLAFDSNTVSDSRLPELVENINLIGFP